MKTFSFKTFTFRPVYYKSSEDKFKNCDNDATIFISKIESINPGATACTIALDSGELFKVSNETCDDLLNFIKWLDAEASE